MEHWIDTKWETIIHFTDLDDTAVGDCVGAAVLAFSLSESPLTKTTLAFCQTVIRALSIVTRLQPPLVLKLRPSQSRRVTSCTCNVCRVHHRRTPLQ